MHSVIVLGPLTPSRTELNFYSARVAAGFPSPAQDHIEQTISLDLLLDVSAPHTYLVRAHGDSMTGAGIFDGDVLVVSRALTPRRGRPRETADIVIAAINGDTFVKRFVQEADQIVLCSDNPRYPPRYILEGDELMIWGVVTDSIRRHRQHG